MGTQGTEDGTAWAEALPVAFIFWGLHCGSQSRAWRAQEGKTQQPTGDTATPEGSVQVAETACRLLRHYTESSSESGVEMGHSKTHARSLPVATALTVQDRCGRDATQ